MNPRTRKRLEARGWKVGSVEEFLGLTKEESAYIELKLILSEQLKARRQKNRMTRPALSKLLKSDRLLVVQMERGDPSVSLDLIIRSLFVLGATRKDLAEMLAPSRQVAI